MRKTKSYNEEDPAGSYGMKIFPTGQSFGAMRWTAVLSAHVTDWLYVLDRDRICTNINRCVQKINPVGYTCDMTLSYHPGIFESVKFEIYGVR